MSDNEMTIDIVGCARCDGDGHKQLTFKKLTFPVETVMSELELSDLDRQIADDPRHPCSSTLKQLELASIPFTHWATCPTNGEPILMRIFDPGEGKA